MPHLCLYNTTHTEAIKNYLYNLRVDDYISNWIVNILNCRTIISELINYTLFTEEQKRKMVFSTHYPMPYRN